MIDQILSYELISTQIMIAKRFSRGIGFLGINRIDSNVETNNLMIKQKRFS